jgi:hypothetical protein
VVKLALSGEDRVMTAVNANIAAPRMLQVGGGAVRQIVEVLGKFGLSRPLVVRRL